MKQILKLYFLKKFKDFITKILQVIYIFELYTGMEFS
jgi:hypothetical protein